MLLPVAILRCFLLSHQSWGFAIIDTSWKGEDYARICLDILGALVTCQIEEDISSAKGRCNQLLPSLTRSGKHAVWLASAGS